MADLSDVLSALATLCDAALFPLGDGQPSAAGSRTVKIYQGWPNNAQLNTDLAAGVVTVSIFPMPGMSKDGTRFQPQWSTPAPAPITLTTSLNSTENVLALAGTCSAAQVIGVETFGVGYAYRMLATDTPATVAAALAAIVPGAVASGATLTATLPLYWQQAVVVSDQTASAEVGRQTDGFQISIWAPDPAGRSAVAAVIKPALDGNQIGGAFTTRVTLPDGSIGILKYHQLNEMDGGQTANLYRRDLIYSVEYPTVLVETFPSAIFLQQGLQIGAGEAVTLGPLQPVNQVLLDATEGYIIMTGSNSPFTTQ